MDFASSTRAAEDRTRGKGIVVKSSVLTQLHIARLWDRLETQMFSVTVFWVCLCFSVVVSRSRSQLLCLERTLSLRNDAGREDSCPTGHLL